MQTFFDIFLWGGGGLIKDGTKQTITLEVNFLDENGFLMQNVFCVGLMLDEGGRERTQLAWAPPHPSLKTKSC